MIKVFRKEYKYVLPITEFLRIQSLLAACLTLDPNGGPDGYLVRSLYFDDLYENDLRDVLDGLLSKQKVRLRLYPPNFSNIKLELKCKTGEDGLKYTIPVTRQEAELLISRDFDFLLQRGEPTAKELYGRMKLGGYLPRQIVEYRRIAYTHTLSDIRITFDTQIRASFSTQSFFDDSIGVWPVTEPDIGVLEVKYSGFLPSYLMKILKQIDMLAGANSKYVNARLML